MRHSYRSCRFVGAVTVLLTASLAPAQSVGGPGSSSSYLVVGLGAGLTTLPKPIVNLCGDGRSVMPTIAWVVGAASSAFRADVRATVFSARAIAGCDPAPPLHEHGTHTDRLYPFEQVYGDRSLSLNLWYAPRQRLWSWGIGGGKLIDVNVPFVAASASGRTNTKIKLVLHVQARALRLKYEDVTREWDSFRVTREIGRESGSEWRASAAGTIGVEFTLP